MQLLLVGVEVWHLTYARLTMESHQDSPTFPWAPGFLYSAGFVPEICSPLNSLTHSPPASTKGSLHESPTSALFVASSTLPLEFVSTLSSISPLFQICV